MQPASDCSSDVSDTRDASGTKNAIDAKGTRDEIPKVRIMRSVSKVQMMRSMSKVRMMRSIPKERCDWRASYADAIDAPGTSEMTRYMTPDGRCPDTAVDTHRPFAGSPNMPWILSSICLPRFPNADCDSPGDELRPIENLKAPREFAVCFFAESQTARLWQQVFRSPQTICVCEVQNANFRMRTAKLLPNVLQTSSFKEF